MHILSSQQLEILRVGRIFAFTNYSCRFMINNGIKDTITTVFLFIIQMFECFICGKCIIFILYTNMYYIKFTILWKYANKFICTVKDKINDKFNVFRNHNIRWKIEEKNNLYI